MISSHTHLLHLLIPSVVVEVPEETLHAGLAPMNDVNGDAGGKQQAVDGYFPLQK